VIAALIAVASVLLAGSLTFAGWLTVKVIGIGEDLAEVKAEHRNNGGSTTRDAIDRIERTGKETRDLLDDHLQVSAADSALLAQHLTHHSY
jgi:hypothetical protein